jgi:hypothetical protein
LVVGRFEKVVLKRLFVDGYSFFDSNTFLLVQYI